MTTTNNSQISYAGLTFENEGRFNGGMGGKGMGGKGMDGQSGGQYGVQAMVQVYKPAFGEIRQTVEAGCGGVVKSGFQSALFLTPPKINNHKFLSANSPVTGSAFQKMLFGINFVKTPDAGLMNSSAKKRKMWFCGMTPNYAEEEEEDDFGIQIDNDLLDKLNKNESPVCRKLFEGHLLSQVNAARHLFDAGNNFFYQQNQPSQPPQEQHKVNPNEVYPLRNITNLNISENIQKSQDTKSESQKDVKKQNGKNKPSKTQKALNTNMLMNSFNFPDGGWVCCQCQNYNFHGRLKCNRCTKPKTKQDKDGKPKHLLKKGDDSMEEDVETPAKQPKKVQAKPLAQVKPLIQAPMPLPIQQPALAVAKRPLTERIGDWSCPRCKNLNFSFRKSCNRCNLNRSLYSNDHEDHIRQMAFYQQPTYPCIIPSSSPHYNMDDEANSPYSFINSNYMYPGNGCS